MIRVFKWLLLVAALAGVAYVVVAVPIGGQTVWERIRGEPESPPAEVKKSDPGPDDAHADRLTDEDRKKLDKLIESKLDEEP